MSSVLTARLMVTYDPEGLTPTQRDGDACVVCHKKWPRPRVRAGRLPDHAIVYACHDCADTLAPPPPAPDDRPCRPMVAAY